MLFIFKDIWVVANMKLMTIYSLEIGLRVLSGKMYSSPNLALNKLSVAGLYLNCVLFITQTESLIAFMVSKTWYTSIS